MTQPDIRKYLYDVLAACELIHKFTAGKSFDEYCQDDLLRSAVERQFEIVGEALNAALRFAPEVESRISHTRRIIGFRNRLAHAYASIADEVVWGVLEDHLPRLIEEVKSALDAADADPV